MSTSGNATKTVAAPSRVGTSAATPLIRPPAISSRNSATTASTRSASLPLIVVTAPAAASRAAIVRPIPCVEPLTNAVRPPRSIRMTVPYPPPVPPSPPGPCAYAGGLWRGDHMGYKRSAPSIPRSRGSVKQLARILAALFAAALLLPGMSVPAHADTFETDAQLAAEWQAAWDFYKFYQVATAPLPYTGRSRVEREISIDITAPRDHVFEVYSNFANH